MGYFEIRSSMVDDDFHLYMLIRFVRLQIIVAFTLAPLDVTLMSCDKVL